MKADTLFFILCLLMVCAVFLPGCTGDDDDDDDDSGASDDDDDDDDNDDNDDDDDDNDDNDDDDDDTTFPPEGQTPEYEKGFILPENSLQCTPIETGVPQYDCNHHGSTVAELPDGTMATVWYHGVAEKSPDARLIWSKFAPDATEWTWPELLYDDPGRSEGNPALWVAEDGTLSVFFVTIWGDSWTESKIRLIQSDDGGDSWDDPVILRNGFCWMTRHRPARLPDGDLLLPLYSECLAYPVFMRSGDNFATWTEESHFTLDYFLGHLGQIQPALTVLEDGTVTAITRDGLPTNKVKRMVSEDNGYTWTSSARTALPNSGTSVDQVTLKDGHVVVVYNDSPETRFPLTVALSHDGGETFAATRNINEECDQASCSYAYPSIAQNTHDGAIWVTYTHNRDTIGWVRFNEAWILDQAE